VKTCEFCPRPARTTYVQKVDTTRKGSPRVSEQTAIQRGLTLTVCGASPCADGINREIYTIYRAHAPRRIV